MKRTYLLAYNLLLFLGWSAFFLLEVATGFEMNRTSLLLLNICQLGALLEILHAILKWVKSPVFTTTIQIMSRVFVLYWINVIPTEMEITLFGISGVHMITIAWGITEIVRYSFYFFSLIEKTPYFLIFLRYTLFIVLYPIGVLGEWLILFSEMKINEWQFSILNIFLAAVILSYFYFFPQLYMYMFRQRAAKLGS